MITGSGGLIIGGCANVQVIYTYTALYNVNEVVYDLKQSKLGFLDAIAVKKVRVANLGGTIMYVDTFNRTWNQYDLCDENTARDNALNYWKNQINDIEAMIRC